MLFWYSLLLSLIIQYTLIDFGNSYLFVLAVSLFILFKLLIPILFKIEFSAPLDTIIHFENPYNFSYIIACCKIDGEINPETIIKDIKTRAFIHPYYNKLKKILISRFGIYYWKECKDFSLNNHIEVLNFKFNSDDELYDFMNSHISEIKFPNDRPKWKIFIAPNLPNKTSGIIIKIHHGITDGLSLMSYLLNLGDSKEYKLINLKKIKPWQYIPIFLFGFFGASLFLMDLIKRKKNVSCFTEKPMTGKKNSYCSNPFALQPIKNYCKFNGISLNEVFLAILYVAVANYHQKKFSSKLNEFSVMIAASLVPIAKNNENIPLTNKTTFFYQDIILREEDKILELAKEYRKSLEKSKKSNSIYFQTLGGKFIHEFLFSYFNEFLMNYITGLYSGIFSSVPGPTTQISLFGYDVKDVFFFVSTPGCNRNVFNIITYNNQFNFGCFTDESTGINSKELVQEFTRIANDLLKLKQK